MKRVLLNSLGQVAGKYWYQESPFTGVGFSIAPDKYVLGFEINEGYIVGDYWPICAEKGTQFMQIDLTGQLSDYVAPMHLGERYTGVGYEFTGNKCDREVFLKNGLAHSEAHWDKNDVLRYFDAQRSGIGEAYEWHSNKNIESIDISTSDKFSGSVSFSEDKKIRRISAFLGFLESFPEIHANARFFPFKSIEDLASCEAMEEVKLHGDGINNNALSIFFEGKIFASLSDLELHNVCTKDLISDCFEPLKKLHVIRDKKSSEEVLFDLEFSRKCKKENPKLRVFFNFEEIF